MVHPLAPIAKRPRSIESLTVLSIVVGTLQAGLFPFYPSIAPIGALLLLRALADHIQRRKHDWSRVLHSARSEDLPSDSSEMFRAPRLLLPLCVTMGILAVAAAFGMLILLLEDFNDFFDALDDEDVGIALYVLASIPQYMLLICSWIAFDLILRRHRREEARAIGLVRRDPEWDFRHRRAMSGEWSGIRLLGKLLLIPAWPILFPLGQLFQLRRHLAEDREAGIPTYSTTAEKLPTT